MSHVYFVLVRTQHPSNSMNETLKQAKLIPKVQWSLRQNTYLPTLLKVPPLYNEDHHQTSSWNEITPAALKVLGQ